MNEWCKAALSKVPEVTLGFWIIKIIATTIGETGGDAVTMSLLHADKNAHNGGYLIGTGIFMAVFIAAVIAQIAMKKFHPVIYWLTIVATTTVGTAMADFADRSLGIGYAGGSSILLALLLTSLLVWRWSEGTVSVEHGRDAAGRGLLLDHHPLLANARHRARRLDGRHATASAIENAALVFGAALRDPRGGLFLHQRVAGVPVLGRLHPDPPARRDARRPVRQADRPGRVRVQPLSRRPRFSPQRSSP